MEKITKDSSVEEIVEKYPFTVKYFFDSGLVCMVCGEPFWGTVAELAESKQFDEKKLEEFLVGLNELIAKNTSGS